MNIDTTNKAFSALEYAARAAQDVCNELNSHENVITRNEHAAKTSAAVFGTGYPDVDELTDLQKEWLDDNTNYVYYGVHYRIRDFIAKAMRYYYCKPAHQIESDRMDTRRADAERACREAGERMQGYLTQITALEETVNAHVAQVARYEESIRNYEINLNGYKKDMDGATSIIDDLRAFEKKANESLIMYQNYLAFIGHSEAFNTYVINEKEKI